MHSLDSQERSRSGDNSFVCMALFHIESSGIAAMYAIGWTATSWSCPACDNNMFTDSHPRRLLSAEETLTSPSMCQTQIGELIGQWLYELGQVCIRQFHFCCILGLGLSDAALLAVTPSCMRYAFRRSSELALRDCVVW